MADKVSNNTQEKFNYRPDWIIKLIRDNHPDDIFSRKRIHKKKIDWTEIENEIGIIEPLTLFLKNDDIPPRIYNKHMQTLLIHLHMLCDLIFVKTGFFFTEEMLSFRPNIDSDEIKKCEDFKKLRFWSLRDLKVTNRLFGIFDKLNSIFITEDIDISLPSENEDPLWKEALNQIGFIGCGEKHLNDNGQSILDSLSYKHSMLFAFSPYENYEDEDIYRDGRYFIGVLPKIQILYYFFYLLSHIYEIEEESLPELIQEYRNSEIGENNIKGWRKDMNLPEQEFIKKLKSHPIFEPWIDQYVLIREGKMHIRQLFTVNKDSKEVDLDKCSNIDTWLTLVNIAAIFYEYDQNQEIVELLKPHFFNDEANARLFLDQIQGASTKMVISIVNKFLKDENVHNAGKPLYKILHDHKLYSGTYSNWSAQITVKSSR